MNLSDTQLPSQGSPFLVDFYADAPITAGFTSLKSQPEIYLDFAAATPVRSKCLQTMLPFFSQTFANPANRLHKPGEQAQNALEAARQTIADCFALNAEEVVFTSSATEANNLLIRGLWNHPLRKRNKIIYCETEHSCVSETCVSLFDLSSQGMVLDTLKVDKNGQILPEQLCKIDDSTLLVCVMDANNETGVVQSKIAEVSAHCQKWGAHLHMDCVQGFARGNFENDNHLWNSAVVSGAKIYGPKGAAALLLKKSKPKVRLQSQNTGGGQENGLRSGTPNMPAIVGFAEACQWTKDNKKELRAHLKSLETAFLGALNKLHPGGISFVAENVDRLPGILSLGFQNVNGMKLAEEAKGICVSVGSACRTLQATASPVLLAMGYELEQALSTIRISFGLPNTISEATLAAEILATAAQRVKADSASC